MKLRNLLLIAAILLLISFGSGERAQLLPSSYADQDNISAVDTADVPEFTRREEMIPMRDGVKLYTIIIIPETVEVGDEYSFRIEEISNNEVVGAINYIIRIGPME